MFLCFSSFLLWRFTINLVCDELSDNFPLINDVIKSFAVNCCYSQKNRSKKKMTKNSVHSVRIKENGGS